MFLSTGSTAAFSLQGALLHLAMYLQIEPLAKAFLLSPTRNAVTKLPPSSSVESATVMWPGSMQVRLINSSSCFARARECCARVKCPENHLGVSGPGVGESAAEIVPSSFLFFFFLRGITTGFAA